MTEPATNTPERRSFVTHVLGLRRWEKNFLLIAIIATITGMTIRGNAYFTDQQLDSLIEKISPYAMRIGISIVIGFIVGWALRSAIRLALSFGLLIVLGWWGLSLLGWVDGDVNTVSIFSSARDATGWMESQADKVSTFVKGYVPSAFGASAGMLVGFRRR